MASRSRSVAINYGRVSLKLPSGMTETLAADSTGHIIITSNHKFTPVRRYATKPRDDAVFVTLGRIGLDLVGHEAADGIAEDFVVFGIDGTGHVIEAHEPDLSLGQRR